MNKFKLDKSLIGHLGGKKILFVLAAVGLLAAGCSGSQTASVNTGAEVTPTPAPVVETSPSPSPQAKVEVKANTNVQVNGADDAVNLLEKNSSNEQAQVAAGDDSDLTASDSADLSSMTEVQNGY